MRTIRPLPVDDIVTVAELCRGARVVVDGYDGAAVIGAIADMAAYVVAHTPRCQPEDPNGVQMIAYVNQALAERGLGRNIAVGGEMTRQLYLAREWGETDVVVIDPDPGDTDVNERIRHAAGFADRVIVVDRDAAGTYQSLGLGALPHKTRLVVHGGTILSVVVDERAYQDTEA